MLKLFNNEITDPFIKENFERLTKIINNQPLMRGEWEFFEVSFPAAVTNFKFKHNLGFKPRDVIETSKIGAGSITFNYSAFDATNIDITTSGALTVRFFAGSYRNEIT
jgi:hypothetical protein